MKFNYLNSNQYYQKDKGISFENGLIKNQIGDDTYLDYNFIFQRCSRFREIDWKNAL